jgi:hypothetical protein
MGIDIRVPSGSMGAGGLPSSFKPVEIIEVGHPGQPTQIIVHEGQIIVYGTTTGTAVITGGMISSADGLTYFDLEVKQAIVMNDGFNDRLYIGRKEE